ncbi:SRPBCC domain-containing protein [Nocardia brasiliensis]|uniref:SRPBCC domain-containing protein n=1 Tax=Nocardia brasiliensis TaxID=37326 RepID=UPI0024585750|nr:SRPBCC domain-containing protein [Nocardia brasiliensis]
MRTIDTRIDMAAPPERVWSVLTDFAAYPGWNPFFVAVDGVAEPGAPLKLHTKFSNRFRTRIFPVTVYTVDAPQVLLWGGGLAIPGIADGKHGFELTATVTGGTHLRHYEQLSGLVIPIAGRLLSFLEHSYEQLNQALKERVESL